MEFIANNLLEISKFLILSLFDSKDVPVSIEGQYMDIGKGFDPEGVQVSIDEIIDKSRDIIECLANYVKD